MRTAIKVSVYTLAALMALLLTACASEPSFKGIDLSGKEGAYPTGWAGANATSTTDINATSTSDTTINETKDWKKLELEGISLSFPPEWEEAPYSALGSKMVCSPGYAAFVTMSIVAGEGPNISQTDEDALKQQYEASLSYEDPSVEEFVKIVIGGEEAISAVLTAKDDDLSGDPDVNLIYYALVRCGNDAIAVTCKCGEDVRTEYEELFKRVVESIAAR